MTETLALMLALFSLASTFETRIEQKNIVTEYLKNNPVERVEMIETCKQLEVEKVEERLCEYYDAFIKNDMVTFSSPSTLPYLPRVSDIAGELPDIQLRSIPHREGMSIERLHRQYQDEATRQDVDANRRLLEEVNRTVNSVSSEQK